MKVLHEILGDPDNQDYLSGVSGRMSKGRILNIHENISGTFDGTVDVLIVNSVNQKDIEATYYKVPVFFHCQGSLTTNHGINAFKIGDEVSVIHTLPDYSIPEVPKTQVNIFDGCEYQEEIIDLSIKRKVNECVVLGFADTALLYCSPPLIAGGQLCGLTTNQLHGYNLCYYTENTFKCSEVYPGGPNGGSLFLQVKYEKNSVFFDEVIIDCVGEEIRKEISHEMITTLTTAQGIAYNEFGATQQTEDFTATVTITDIDQYRIYKFEKFLSLITYDKDLSFSANLNTDRTKLYVVWSSEYARTQYSTQRATVNYETYERVISDNAETITWELIQNGQYTVDWFIDHLFVDDDGLIYGLTDFKNNPGDTSRKINIKDGELSSAGSHSTGVTIIDGKFSGIFKNTTYEEPSGTDTGWVSNSYGWVCSGWTVADTIIDDGLVDQDNSGICPSMNCTPCGISPECYSTSVARDNKYYYWRTRDILNYNSAALIETVSYGTSNTTATTGSYYEYHALYESHGEWLGTIGCGCTRSTCTSLKTTKDCDLFEKSNNTTEGYVVNNGTITKYTTGTSNNGTYSQRVPVSTATDSGFCTGFCSSSSPDLVYDCGCGNASGECCPSGACSTWMVFNQWTGHCISVPLQNDIYDNKPDIKYPFVINNASGGSSFIAWDSNENGLVIKGIRYTHDGDTESNVKITINDTDVTSSFFESYEKPTICEKFPDGCRALKKENFYYLGFLY